MGNRKRVMMIGFITLLVVVILAIVIASFISRPNHTNEQQNSSKDADV
jgi:flagellar basal body-associated protein FliL